MFTIRSFNNNTKATSPEELVETLREKYLGDDVSVQFTKKSGIRFTEFVSIDKKGILRHTYGTQGLLDVAYFQTLARAQATQP